MKLLNSISPYLRLTSIILIAIVLLSACSNNSQNEANTGNVNESNENSSTEKVEIEFWTTNKDEYKEEISKFEEENPNIKVTTSYMGNYDEMAQKVQSAIVGNTLPQVAQLGQRHGIPQIADSGKLIPIEEFFSQEDIDDIFSGFWDRFTYKDKLWTTPFQSSNPVMYYNKTLFETQNVDVPNTWDELIDAAEKLTIDEDSDGTPDVWGFNMAADNPWYFQPMTWNRGGFLVNEKGEVKLNSKEAVETLQSFQDLVHKQKAMPANQHETAKEDFSAGRIAMLFTSGASLASFNEEIGDSFEVGVAFLPEIKERHVPIGGNSLGIFESTPEQEEASAKLVKFLTSTEQSAEFSMNSGYIAIRESSLNLDSFQQHLEKDPNFKVTIDQLEYLYGQPISPADSLIWSGIVEAIEMVEVDPNADPQELLDNLQDEVVSYLEEYNG